MSGPELPGRVALVTGAAGGLGAAVARELHAAGAAVVAADVDERVHAVAAGIGGNGLSLDVSDARAWDAATALIRERHGGLDILVNNAGVSAPPRAIADTSPEDYLRVIHTNQLGAFLGMRAAAPLLRDRGGGSIVNISSVLGRQGRARSAPYVASKFAITGMTKVAALELAEWGVRVNSVHPGAVDTPMLRRALPDGGTGFAARVPLHRVGDPAEVARLVVFLAGDGASYCTGAEFVVDGGQSCGVPDA